MLVNYNQTFYDLNNKRQYCLAAPEQTFPLELISDLKISVPNNSVTPIFKSIFIKGQSVRLLFTILDGDDDERLVLSFRNDGKSTMKLGEPYTLTTIYSGYAGIVVFGEGIKNDCNFASSVGNLQATPPTHTKDVAAFVSEECLTRFRRPAINRVGIACTSVGLGGEVTLGGEETMLRTSVQNLPTGHHSVVPSVTQGLYFDLIDTGTKDANNPTILMANGINRYVGAEGQRCAVFTIASVPPDENGRITMEFKDHFLLAAVVDPEANEIVVGEDGVHGNALAVWTDITMDDVCGKPKKPDKPDDDEDVEESCTPRDIQIFKINP